MFGLLSLLSLDLAALGSQLIWGTHNAFATAVMSVDVHMGLLLFAALSAYDTHVAVQAYRRNPHQSTHLLAVDLFWSLLNFFLRLMELIRKYMK